jgi:hypothetical protein
MTNKLITYVKKIYELARILLSNKQHINQINDNNIKYSDKKIIITLLSNDSFLNILRKNKTFEELSGEDQLLITSLIRIARTNPYNEKNVQRRINLRKQDNIEKYILQYDESLNARKSLVKNIVKQKYKDSKELGDDFMNQFLLKLINHKLFIKDVKNKLFTNVDYNDNYISNLDKLIQSCNNLIEKSRNDKLFNLYTEEKFLPSILKELENLKIDFLKDIEMISEKLSHCIEKSILKISLSAFIF